jgi:tRNA pseudouridine55 synthase
VISGWMLLDKPVGISSSGAIAVLKKKLNTMFGEKQKVGHCGTLDPLASGVLVVALGEATKLSDWVMQGSKEYVFEMTWGQMRSTADAEGEVLYSNELKPNLDEVRGVLESLAPSYMQVPPLYSALKMGGKKAYDRARNGEVFEMQARLVELHMAEILWHQDGKTAIRIRCGKGFYVRSLAVDVARTLGAAAYVSSLRRVGVGNFYEQDAIVLEKVQKMVYSSELRELILPIRAVLDDILVQQVSVEQSCCLVQGKVLKLEPVGSNHCTETVVACCGDIPVAICRFEAGYLKPKRVFNLMQNIGV